MNVIDPNSPLADISDFDLHALVQHYKLGLQPPGHIQSAYGDIDPSVFSSNIDVMRKRKMNPGPNLASGFDPTPPMAPGPNGPLPTSPIGWIGRPLPPQGGLEPGDPRSGGEIMGQAAQDHIDWLNSVNGGGERGPPKTAEGIPIVFPENRPQQNGPAPAQPRPEQSQQVPQQRIQNPMQKVMGTDPNEDQQNNGL